LRRGEVSVKDVTVRDCAAVLGLGLVGAGACWLSPPAALIAVGSLLILASLWGWSRGDP